MRRSKERIWPVRVSARARDMTLSMNGGVRMKGNSSVENAGNVIVMLLLLLLLL